MNFKLASGAALVFLASFATSTFYRAGHKIANANKIGLTKLTENFQVEFSFTVGADALGDAWRNILHIGSNDHDRRPALFFSPGTLALHAGWNTNDDFSTQSELNTGPLSIGFTYEVSMMMLNNHVYFCVYGQGVNIVDQCQDTIYSGTNYQDESIVEIWGSAPRDWNSEEVAGFYSNPDSENFGRIENLMIREVIEYGVLGDELITFMSQSN
jgi:hypothetical protein